MQANKNQLLDAVQDKIARSGLQMSKSAKPEMAVSHPSYAGQMTESAKGLNLA